MVTILAAASLLQTGITSQNNQLVYKCQTAITNTMSLFDYIKSTNYSLFSIVLNLFTCNKCKNTSSCDTFETLTFTKIRSAKSLNKLYTFNNTRSESSNNPYETLNKSIKKCDKFEQCSDIPILPLKILKSYIYQLYNLYEIKFLSGTLSNPSAIEDIFLVLNSYSCFKLLNVFVSTNNLTLIVNINSCNTSSQGSGTYKVSFSIVNNFDKIIILTHKPLDVNCSKS